MNAEIFSRTVDRVVLCGHFTNRSMADDNEEVPLVAGEMFPHYDEWLTAYEAAKNYSNWPFALRFLARCPAAVNNRKNGSNGCTLLHQAGFWGVDRGILEQLRALGADPHLVATVPEPRTAADMALIDTAEHAANAPAAALIRAVFNVEAGSAVRTEADLRAILEKAHLDPATFAETIKCFGDAELRTVFHSACRRGHFSEVQGRYSPLPNMQHTHTH